MKKFLLFIACTFGIIFLLVLTTPFIVFFDSNADTTNNNITLFEQDGEIVSENSFEIYEVLDSGNALAWELDDKTESRDLQVMFLNDEEKHYYDKQIIKVPKGKCLKQIGVYKEFTDTYPIVAIRDK